MPRRCLILGSALNWQSDYEAALDISEFEGVIAAKRAGVLWPTSLTAWVTLHPDRAKKDLDERRALGYPDPLEFISHCVGANAPGITRQVEYKFEQQRTSGSSGLFAVKVALELGFTRCVLCGIPLEGKYGRIDTKGDWMGSNVFLQGFLQAMPHIQPYVRSMSGWTEQRLGRPTAEWLESD